MGSPTLIKISLLEGRVMTNASALPVQRQVLEQLFITDPKVGFGQAPLLSICHSDLSNIIQCQQDKWLKPTSYITHKTLCSSLILMLFAICFVNIIDHKDTMIQQKKISNQCHVHPPFSAPHPLTLIW